MVDFVAFGVHRSKVGVVIKSLDLLWLTDSLPSLPNGLSGNPSPERLQNVHVFKRLTASAWGFKTWTSQLR